MSEVDNSLVKKGFWINWSKGSVMGRTITTDAEVANVIIAVLTVMITVATAQLWNLLTFFYHQFRAGGLPSDGLYWQQQALLRTLPTPTGLIADNIKLWWVWRRKSKRALMRSLLPVVLAFLFAVGAVSSGIFSTYAVDTSNVEILVDSPYCGKVNISRLFPTGTAASTHYAQLMPVAKEYTRECYQDRMFLPTRCHNTFVQSNISISRDPADCPWESSMCSSQSSPAISMDSGLLDQSHFGFNVRSENGIKFRRKTTCNVLPLDGYVSVTNASEFAASMPRKPLPDEKMMGLHYFYHPNKTLDISSMEFSRSVDAINITNRYYIDAYLAYTDTPGDRDVAGAYFQRPLAEMNRTDADVATIAVWLNAVLYDHPVDDPVFAAHDARNASSRGASFHIYASDNPAGVIGCSVQSQFCIGKKGNNDTCTDLRALPSSSDALADLLPDANDVQRSMLDLIWEAMWELDLSTGANYDYLQAGELLERGRMPKLPDDQWKKETVGWESVAWAGIQIRLADYAIGPKVRDPNADAYVINPSTPAEKQLCNSMKMRKSGGFANINVFGLAFIITFSAIVSFLNMTILRFCIFLSRFRRALAPRIDRWVQDGVFQLQRRAFEAHGQGSWSRLDKEVPSTAGGQRLPELPIGSMPAMVLTPQSSFGTVDTKKV